MVERTNGYLETSLLPGRRFASPGDVNTSSVTGWYGPTPTQSARSKAVRWTCRRPTTCPWWSYHRSAHQWGLRQRIRLNRDHYVRVDTVDYSVDPHSIGRFVEATASAHMVTVCCDGQVVARHHHGDGHPVTLRALPDYDALFGVDFNPSPTKASSE